MTAGPPNLPPGVPPQAPQWPGWPNPTPPARESRGVAFFVAIFLGILLVASAGLNVLLLLVSVGSLAGAGLGADSDGVAYEEVHIAGERGGRDKVLQVPIRGAIAEGAAPLLGAAGGTVSQVRRALRMAAAPDVLGVLLYVDSPGGGVTDSDVIYQLVRAFRRDHPDKPVLALFGDIAASGGYYVGVAAEHILARRTAITGSIGVIMSAWNFTEAARKVGVDQVVIKSERTPYKDMLSPTRPMTPEERAMLTSIVDELFDQFVSVVDEGRPNLDRAQVLAAANGGIYTASQAQALGLVDELGDHDAALAWFRGKLGKSVTVVEPRRRAGLGDLLFGALASGRGTDAAVAHLLSNSTGPRFLYYWEGGR
jgi:protease-4